MGQMRCCLCAQVQGGVGANLLQQLLGTRWSTRPVLLENDVAVVMPSIGALAPGHVLVSPKLHARSLATTPRWCWDLVEQLAHEAAEHLRQVTGELVHGFEHGSARSGERVACSVEHAHLHLLPASVSIDERLASLGSWTAIGADPEALFAAVQSEEYLLYRHPSGQRYVKIAPRNGFPSQLMRRVFADALDVAEYWNWRVHSAENHVRATIDLFTARQSELVAADA